MRLKKDGAFWLCVAAVLVCSVVNILSGAFNAEGEHSLENYFFNMVPVIGLFIAAFGSLFLGTEYSDGTLRNKLVVGHTRTDIYAANFLTCFFAAAVFDTAWFIGGLAGIPTLGLWRIGEKQMLLMLAASLLASMAVAAIITLVGMTVTNRAAAAVISMMMFLGMLLLASMIYNALSEPEMLRGAIVTENGISVGEPELNPDYIGGKMRTFYELILDILPTGQCIQIANLELERPVRDMAFSVILSLVAVFGGIALFKRKNIK